MYGLVLLTIGLVGGGEYARGLDARALDQASFDAETYGVKKVLTREPDGLRIKLEAGAEETGWKTPPQLKIGGDFTIVANLVIKTLPKPLQEDGAAIGLAIAQGDINQPDLTFMRLREPGGREEEITKLNKIKTRREERKGTKRRKLEKRTKMIDRVRRKKDKRGVIKEKQKKKKKEKRRIDKRIKKRKRMR